MQVHATLADREHSLPDETDEARVFAGQRFVKYVRAMPCRARARVHPYMLVCDIECAQC